MLRVELTVETVIFACVHNAGRSQMAAAFFNEAADPAKARAISAGTSPVRTVHPEVVVAMKEVGINLESAVPRRLTDDLARDAAWLITMGCGEACPIVRHVMRAEWALEDPHDQPIERVREIRDEIRERIRQFVAAHRWL